MRPNEAKWNQMGLNACTYRHGLQAANDLPSLLRGVLLCKVVPLLGSKPGRPKVCHLRYHIHNKHTKLQPDLGAQGPPRAATQQQNFHCRSVGLVGSFKRVSSEWTADSTAVPYEQSACVLSTEGSSVLMEQSASLIATLTIHMKQACQYCHQKG